MEDVALLRKMALFQGQDRPLILDPPPHPVLDITGVEDTVASVLSLALATGAGLEQAVRLAHIAATLVVGKVKVRTVRMDELNAALKRRSSEGPSSP